MGDWTISGTDEANEEATEERIEIDEQANENYDNDDERWHEIPDDLADEMDFTSLDSSGWRF